MATRQQQTTIWQGRAIMLLVAALPFAYVPTLYLGTRSGINLDVSLLYVVVLVVTGGLLVTTPLAQLRQTFARLPLLWLLVAFAGYSALSCLWSPNDVKALATSGFLVMLVGAVVALACHAQWIATSKRRLLMVASVPMTLAVVFSYWQIFAETIGLSDMWSLLPVAYQSALFGFARPTGFSLEPQFFGSLLALASLILSVLFVAQKPGRNRQITGVLSVLYLAMLLLTLSRGALYAFVIGGLVLCIASFVLRRTTVSLRATMQWMGLAGVALALSTLIVFAASSSNLRDDISGEQALEKYVSQVSLGALALDLVPDTTSPPPQTPVAVEPAPIAPPPDGYVAESTNSRLDMVRVATTLWTSSPLNFIFGVGFGGYGFAAHAHDARYTPDSIVNNYYAETAVETGLIGIGLFGSFLLLLAYYLYRQRLIVPLGLLAVVTVQWLFNSGNANAVHVWVLFGLCLVALSATKPYRSRQA